MRKTAATSEEGENIRQDLQKNCRAGDRKANSRVFDLATESERLNNAEESVSSETKGDTLKAQPSEKKDNASTPGCLASYQETALDERSCGGSNERSWGVITVRTEPRRRKARPITCHRYVPSEM
jgi:hypothetical protein